MDINVITRGRNTNQRLTRFSMLCWTIVPFPATCMQDSRRTGPPHASFIILVRPETQQISREISFFILLVGHGMQPAEEKPVPLFPLRCRAHNPSRSKHHRSATLEPKPESTTRFQCLFCDITGRFTPSQLRSTQSSLFSSIRYQVKQSLAIGNTFTMNSQRIPTSLLRLIPGYASTCPTSQCPAPTQ